ncbi:MAG: histidinol dehydrogenase [Clostridia bacterium]|jgi:histidinol dehydrogenase|nr:histidinol dehydrogenase [Clostridia bacterium]MBT7122631.1 histidinol dehydrogenase [Clostridia bacterium]
MRIYKSSEIDEVKNRLNRKASVEQDVLLAVRDIIANVEKTGDKALFEYTARFDGFALSADNIRVTKQEIKQAYDTVSSDLLDILKRSASNIRTFHEKQKREGYRCENDGAVTGRLILPMAKAGVYVPGGTAAYPSSVLMNIIPAKIAGVSQIIMATPPGDDGIIEPFTLVAADIAGADAILKIGGAQAVAALAYGTDSVPKVDVITGPGNAYVAAAKREVYGQVGIDMIAGPSEVLIIADESANPKYIAADFLSQAEHDVSAASVLLTTSESIAVKSRDEILRQLNLLSRKSIAQKSVDDYGTIVVVSSINEAFEIANEFAPEHLEILTNDPWSDLEKVKNAGAVFLGEYSPEPLGDYFAGTNHVLPTSGSARFSSPLSVDDFIKKTNYICYDKKALKSCYNDIASFAQAEGLDAHAKSANVRFDIIEEE